MFKRIVLSTRKSIENFPYYEVSNFGNVRSVDRVFTDTLGRKVNRKGKLLKCDTNGRYKLVRLYNISQGKVIALLVNRLVAQAFIPNPDNLPCVNHKDENSFKQRLSKSLRGENNGMYGKAPANKGVKMSDEQKEKLRLSHLGNNKGRHWKLIDGKRVWYD